MKVLVHETCHRKNGKYLRLLFSLKPKEMAKMRFLALKQRKKYCDISYTQRDFETEIFYRKWV